jgi:hypothetical protein
MLSTAPKRQGATRLPEIVAGVLVAALAYGGLILFYARSILGKAADFVLVNNWADPAKVYLTLADQHMVLGTVTQGARALSNPLAPTWLSATCFPAQRAWALGEHMLSTSLLAALPLHITDNPILAYNFAIGLSILIPALGAFLLGRELTGNSFAGFIAGLFYGFSSLRLIDPAHPYAYDQWFPFFLLALHRCFRTGGWLATVCLALFTVLVALQSPYGIVGDLLLLSVLFPALLIHFGVQGLRRASPGIVASLVAGAILFSYLHYPYILVKQDWDLAQDVPVLGWLNSTWLLPGGRHFPGLLVLALALAGIVRGKLAGDDRGPDFRWAYLGSAAIIWLAVVESLPLPGDLHVAGILRALRESIPVFRVLREPTAIAAAIVLPLSILAAFGLRMILSGRSLQMKLLITALCAIFFVGERFLSSTSRVLTGTIQSKSAFQFSLPPDLTELLAQASGPILEWPVSKAKGYSVITVRPPRVLRAAWSGQPTSTCYNSRKSSVGEFIRILSQDISSPATISALSALGFRNLIIDKYLRGFQENAERHQWDSAPPEGARFVTATDYFELYEIEPVSFGSELSVLSLESDARLHRPQADAESATLDLKFRNTSSQAFRLPNPRLLKAELCWVPASGGDSDCFEERLLLPLALGPLQTLLLPQVVKAPEPDDSYELTIRTISPDWRGQATIRR